MRGRRIPLPVVIAMLSIMASVAPVKADDAVDEASEWVMELPRDQVYTDGYVPRTDPSLLTMQGQLAMVPVQYLPYANRAWAEFLEIPGLTGAQRDPRHYKLGFELTAGRLAVTVQGLLLPHLEAGAPAGVLRVSIGPSAWFQYDFVSGELLESRLLR